MQRVPRLANLRSRLALSLGLALLTLVSYEGVRRCGFVGFDDDLYVYRNPQVQGGLTWAGLRWAFTADLLFESPNADYWMPVTILSRMLDVELFGLDPAGHHAMNAFLHALNVVLMFLLLEGLTGAAYRSAFAAAVLAVHPLTVESVAWVTERKDVLSGAFWALTLMAYARYATRRSRAAYALALVFLALGLMAKPTLVVLPAVLLVLDFWPLARWRRPSDVGGLLIEKVPFLALAAVSGVLTMLAHSRGGHLVSADALPFELRLANALWSLVVYLEKLLWPTGLAVFYPHPRGLLASGRTAAALLLVGGLSWLAAANARRRPYLLAGWLWFLLPLALVLGLIQTGEQGWADRFMYIPLVGVGILAAWGGADLASSSRAARESLRWVAPGILCIWVALTRAQVRRWENTVTLFTHALAVTEGNYLAQGNLATALVVSGDLAGAERHYREAIRIRPVHWTARTGLGVLLMRSGRLPEALEQQREARRLNPGSADVCFNLGAVEARMGRTADAEAHYAEALSLNPGLAVAHYNWGNLLAEEGRWAEAEARFAEAVRLEPEDAEARNNLGLAIGLQGRWEAAAAVFRRVLAAAPGHARARMNLARALSELGHASEARAMLEEGLRRSPGDLALQQALDELARP
jgi:tetratricopeptide (TPR) repeat protein